MKYKWCVFIFGFFLSIILAICFTNNVSASPAAPIDQELTQPDGTKFIARQWGDEWSNGFETLDGFTILQDSDGWWLYAQETIDGILLPAQSGGADLRVGYSQPDDIPLHVRPAYPEVELIGSQRSTNRAQFFGDQPVLVLLVQFSNRVGSYSAENFQEEIFGTTNSVKDFYQDASYNQLNLIPAYETYGTANDGIIGWLNMGYPHPNTGDYTADEDNKWLVRMALEYADPYINYASFDTNSNGYISSDELIILVVAAGFENAFSNDEPNVWAHHSSLNYGDPPTKDGVILCDFYNGGGYSLIGEIHEDHQATIGIIAHEFGHEISWPDLYDIDGSSEGVGDWSLMSSGNWNFTGSNYPGSSPALPDAWLKYYQGWVTPVEVSGALTSASIPQAENVATVYRLKENLNGVDWEFNEHSGEGEYFLAENRQLTGYDAGLPGCGLLVWHIDESVVFTNYANKNEFHPLVKLLQADGYPDLEWGYNRGDDGDPFPGSSTNRTFDYSSDPDSRMYSGDDSLVEITNISNCAVTMNADFSFSAPSTPSLVWASDGAFSDSVVISWFESDGATEYQVFKDISDDHSGAALLGTTTDSHYHDYSVTTGTTYYYWLKACNSVDCSDYSSYDTGYRSGSVTIPSTPSTLSASDSTYTDKVEITWIPVIKAAWYRILRSEDKDIGGAKLLADDITFSPYNDTSAEPGITYYYWLIACNSAGCSGVSPYDTGERALAIPAPPAGVTASDGSYASKVKITWPAASRATYYQVYRNTSNEHTGQTVLTSSTTKTDYDDSSAVPGTTYFYWIRACNSSCSTYSSPDTGYRPAAITIPSAPGDVSASLGTFTDRVRISWTPVEGAAFYKVYRNSNNIHDGEVLLSDSTSASPYNDTSAVPWSAYYYWVRACNEAGCSDYSPYDLGYRGLEIPTSPTNTSATDGDYTDKVRVTWDAPLHAFYYIIFRNTGDTHEGEAILTTGQPSSPYDDATAVPDTDYFYWVKACNDSGCSDYSSVDSGFREFSLLSNSLFLPLIIK